MSTIKCPFCGKELPTESSFCPYCMEQIKTPVTVSLPTTEEKSRKGISVMILITAVVVLAVVMLMVLRFCGNEGNKSPRETVGEGSAAVNEDVTESEFGNVDSQEPEQSGAVADTGEPQISVNVSVTSGDTPIEPDPGALPSESVPVNGTTQGYSDSGSNDVTSTQPQATACSHNWVAQTKTVYHEEEGHFEEVERSRPVTVYECPVCYKDHTSLNLYYTHFDTIHLPLYEGDPIGMFRDQYTTETGYENYTEEIWVVDREAYSENITTGYKCSKCGKMR